jgi:hypothetical protein
MMAAGAAPLALEFDVFKDSLYNDAGQEIPLKKREKEAT